MYELSWCIMGETPEAEPFWFADGRDAVHFLIEEITWLIGDLEAGEARKQASQALLALRGMQYSPRSVMFPVGDIVYWINNLDEIRESIEMLEAEEL